MALTSMKLPAQASKDPCECLVSPQREEYPWGLRIHLEAEQLAALGIKDLPEVGAEIQIVAIAKVVSASISASEGQSREHRSVGLQLTDMELAPPPSAAKKKSTASVLFGGDE